MIKGRIFFDIFLLVGAAWILSISRNLPPAYNPGEIGPGFFPLVVSGLGVVIVLAVLLGDLRSVREGTDAAQEPIGRKAVLGTVGVVVLLIGYILMIPLLGFLLSTVLFLFLAFALCRVVMDPTGDIPWWSARDLSLCAATAFLATFITYAVFTYGFGLNL